MKLYWDNQTSSKWALFYNSTRKELLLTLVPTMTQGVFFAHHGLPFDQILSVICSQGEIWYTPLIDDWGDSALFLEVQCSFSTDSSFSCQNIFFQEKVLLSFVTMFRKIMKNKLTTWNAIWFDKKSPCWDLVDIELRSGPAKGWYGRELRIVGVSTQTCYAAVASFSIQGPLPSPGGWNSLTFRFKNNHLDLFEQCFWGGFWCRAEDNDLVHKNKKTLYFSPFL